jgi:hypothetical protein
MGIIGNKTELREEDKNVEVINEASQCFLPFQIENFLGNHFCSVRGGGHGVYFRKTNMAWAHLSVEKKSLWVQVTLNNFGVKISGTLHCVQRPAFGGDQ